MTALLTRAQFKDLLEKNGILTPTPLVEAISSPILTEISTEQTASPSASTPVPSAESGATGQASTPAPVSGGGVSEPTQEPILTGTLVVETASSSSEVTPTPTPSLEPSSTPEITPEPSPEITAEPTPTPFESTETTTENTAQTE